MSIATASDLEIVPTRPLLIPTRDPWDRAQSLASLGPHAVPALRLHRKEIPAPASVIYESSYDDGHLPSGNRRPWSFRTWRRDRYLANNLDAAFNASRGDRG